jgi:hypothetical protein
MELQIVDEAEQSAGGGGVQIGIPEKSVQLGSLI